MNDEPAASTALELYGYWRSSAVYRVRIALALKGLAVVHHPVHLVRDGGQQFSAEHRARNPQALVPTLVDGGTTISQSLAIIEYLDERFPAPPLLPADPAGRAHARQLALAVACDIHPLNNLRVQRYLEQKLGAHEVDRQQWMEHWMRAGFAALEQLLTSSAAGGSTGRFCVGDTPGLADCCLIPQLFNARRIGMDLQAYPRLLAVDQACQALDAFRLAHPDQQADSEAPHTV